MKRGSRHALAQRSDRRAHLIPLYPLAARGRLPVSVSLPLLVGPPTHPDSPRRTTRPPGRPCAAAGAPAMAYGVCFSRRGRSGDQLAGVRRLDASSPGAAAVLDWRRMSATLRPCPGRWSGAKLRPGRGRHPAPGGHDRFFCRALARLSSVVMPRGSGEVLRDRCPGPFGQKRGPGLRLWQCAGGPGQTGRTVRDSAKAKDAGTVLA